jgi:hypothetical protein
MTRLSTTCTTLLVSFEVPTAGYDLASPAKAICFKSAQPLRVRQSPTPLNPAAALDLPQGRTGSSSVDSKQM